MLKRYPWALLVIVLTSLTLEACGTPPIRAKLISGGDNAWVEDEETSNLMFCVGNPTGERSARPLCYTAKRGSVRISENTESSSSFSTGSSNRSSLSISSGSTSAPTTSGKPETSSPFDSKK